MNQTNVQQINTCGTLYNQKPDVQCDLEDPQSFRDALKQATVIRSKLEVENAVVLDYPLRISALRDRRDASLNHVA